ncbi:MAG: YvcK family protein [Thermicanus sp.]|nr:YvcK family protein [Thermicanus sp.]
MKPGIQQEKAPKVVAVGGGTGLSVLLRGLKEFPFSITAIVTVADDGGSSGRLRKEMQIPPPGDVRNVLLALSDVEPLLDQLLQFRFNHGGELDGHNLGNLLIAAMTEITGDFVSAIRELSRVLAVRGEVLPSASEPLHLGAIMEDGTTVMGESLIPLAGKRISRVFIEPADAHPLKEAIEAIWAADLVIVGPGSLYTSILPNLLVGGITEAMKSSRAKKIFIVNLMTQPGETDHYTASDHLRAVHDHVGDSFFDYILVNNGKIPSHLYTKYLEKNQEVVRYDQDSLSKSGYKVIVEDFLLYDALLRHNAKKVGETLMRILKSGE